MIIYIFFQVVLIFSFFSGDNPRSNFSSYIDRGDGSKFRCTLCGKEFKESGTVNKHIENIHFPGTYTYYCKFCPESFGTRNNLYKHISKNHPK